MTAAPGGAFLEEAITMMKDLSTRVLCLAGSLLLTAACGSGSAEKTGGAGTSDGGLAGTSGGGLAGAPGGGDGAVDTTPSVLTRNKHETRDGFFIQPTLTRATVAKMALDAGFKATFQGAMWASPLYLENGPKGKGAFFAVTTGNDVYALDETTGATLWTKNVGTAPGRTGVNSGTSARSA